MKKQKIFFKELKKARLTFDKICDNTVKTLSNDLNNIYYDETQPQDARNMVKNEYDYLMKTIFDLRIKSRRTLSCIKVYEFVINVDHIRECWNRHIEKVNHVYNKHEIRTVIKKPDPSQWTDIKSVILMSGEICIEELCSNMMLSDLICGYCDGGITSKPIKRIKIGNGSQMFNELKSIIILENGDFVIVDKDDIILDYITNSSGVSSIKIQ